MLLFVGTAFNISWLESQKNRLGTRLRGVIVLSFAHTVFGVLAVTVFAVLESMDFSSFGSFSLFGAVFFMPIYYFAVAKRLKVKPKETFDLFTPCVVTTLMLSRFSCLHSGCCLGTQIKGTSFRWPTREAEIVFYLFFLLIIIPRIREKRTTGEAYPLYMVTYGCLRFILEFCRESSFDGVFHLSHLWAGLAVIIGLSVYFEQKKKTMRSR